MAFQLLSDKIERSDFEYHEQIGQGGCGTVFRATFKQKYNDYTEAAAKVLTNVQHHEIDILKRLRHDHVVTLIGYFTDGPTKDIFFEYTQFGSLDKYLSKDTTPLPVELQRRWTKEAALAIQYLHKEKILHRDVKASNCLLFNSPTGTLKLCDFGLARDLDHSQTTSTQKGTYRFWAPEIICTDDRNHAIFSTYTDIWAYGMLVYEICSRRLPFFDKEWQVVIRRVGKGDLLPTIPDDCPRVLHQIMGYCWKFEPKERPSINKVVQDLALDHWRAIQTMQPVLKVPGQQPQKLKALRIVCCQDGSMVEADNDKPCRYMVTLNGDYKAALESPFDGFKINCICSIAVTQQYIAFCEWATTSITIFNYEGPFVKQFEAVTENLSSYYKNGIGLATDKNNNLLVYGGFHKVTWYSCPEFELLKQIELRIEIKSLNVKFSRLAINTANQMIFYDDCERISSIKVVAFDNTGKQLFSISPQIGERTTGKTYKGFDLGVCGLVTDDNDAIFIAMKVSTPKIRIGMPITGHIHRYTSGGEFQQCIISDLNAPQDLAMTPDGSLVVANGNSILKYNCEPAGISQ